MYIPLTDAQGNTLGKLSDLDPGGYLYLESNGSGPEDSDGLSVVAVGFEDNPPLFFEISPDGEVTPPYVRSLLHL